MVSLYLHAHDAGGCCLYSSRLDAPRLSMPEGVYKTPEEVLAAQPA